MRDMIAYMNARRALKPASGGAKQNHSAKYAPDVENTDGYDIARNAIGAFSLWAETTRQVQAARLAIPQAETMGECDEMPF